MEQSTRLSILEHALADVVERLDELPRSKDAEALRTLARRYETELERWEREPPDEDTRRALLKDVLDLEVEVIRAGGRVKAPDESDDADDAFPRPI